MTDNEIIKALEYCGRVFIECDGSFCNECPFNGKAKCQGFLFDNALGLINRQKAEIDKLKKVKQHIDALICRSVEYPTAARYEEAFQKALEQLYDATNAKAEAYKEFVERFLNSYVYGDSLDEEGYRYAERLANDILKEMASGNSL